MIRLLLGSVLIVAGGLSRLILHRRARLADLVYAALLLGGAALGLSSAIAVLRGSGPALLVELPGSLPGGPWAFGLDRLSAWFLLAILGVGACAAVFGLGYLEPERAHRPVAPAHGLFSLLLVALVGVVTAQAMAPFLIAWEVMALCGYLLIMFEHEQAEVRRAGFIYIALTHVSMLALLAMFAALSAHADGRTFAALAAGSGGATRTLVLLLTLVGFGIKAGVVPLHFWLPGAHAAAPSHVSAVLSGLMLKMGIYGLLRMLCLLGPTPAWFGWTLLGLGVVSGVLGVLWALGEHDLKRVLAYSSVENIGIILLGMGTGALGLAYGRPGVAMLGFAGALLHTLNHALFKSLLFLGAGSVLRATGTRVIEQLGGLARELPWTALAFGVGSVAIVGLPPLNGFVSEWVVVQGLLEGARQPGLLAVLVLAVTGLGLIAALALACFTRAVGGVFLGQARRPRGSLREQPGLVGAMLVLAVACAIVGLVPVIVVEPAMAATGVIMAGGGIAAASPSQVIPGAATLSGAWAVLIGLGALLWYLRRRAQPVEVPIQGVTWGCGYAEPTSRMQYTAGSFSTPLLLAFGSVAAPEVERTAGSFRTRARDRVLDGLVGPLWRGTRALANAFRPLQLGPVTRYLQYIVLTVLLLLVALFASIVRGP
jgi:hydrogenase-4 component B